MGYLLALACTQAGRTSGFRRSGAVSKVYAGPQIQEALKNRPGFNSSLAKRAFKAAEDGVLITWTFPSARPNWKTLSNLLDASLKR